MAFFGGSAGIIYKQFAITIVSAMTLSVIVALVFTPALCATMLRPSDVDHQQKKGFFGWFNRMFDRGTARYERGVAGILRRRGRSEEHTSELQSLMRISYAVFCLKKKKNT